MKPGLWIGIVAGIIGMAIGFIAIVSSGIGRIVPLIILCFFLFFLFIFYKLLIGPMLNANRLRKTGLPGKARVLAVKDTGITINNNPVAKLELEVKDQFGQRYTTSARIMVSRINPMAYTPGMEVPVKIDPNKKENVIIDTDRPPTANTEAVKSELEKLQEEKNAISLSGRSARAIIKKYNWLGTYVNGNNPYVELDVEVLPEHSTSFGGKTRAVISEAAVHRFQPGCEIQVKYDLYDNSKIVVDHS